MRILARKKKSMWLAGLALGITAAMALAGGEPWKDKPYTQWTEEDATRVLQDSPWAKIMYNVGGTARLHGNGNLGGESGIQSGNGAYAAGGMGTVLPAEHETQLNDPRAPKTYAVVWWSARTTREAAARREVLKGLRTPQQAAQELAAAAPDYQVLIEGPDLSIFDRRAPESFMNDAFIQMKSTKVKASPSSVEYLHKADGHVSGVIFHFAKTDKTGEPVVTPNEKEISFYLHVGDGEIVTGFDPKKMEDSHGIDL